MNYSCVNVRCQNNNNKSSSSSDINNAYCNEMSSVNNLNYHCATHIHGVSLDWDTIESHNTMAFILPTTRQLHPVPHSLSTSYNTIQFYPYQQKIVQLFWINMQSDRTRKSDPHINMLYTLHNYTWNIYYVMESGYNALIPHSICSAQLCFLFCFGFSF